MRHTPGPWTLNLYESGTVCVSMRTASGKGPPIMGPDHSYQDGYLAAHINLYNVSAFTALTGETEDRLTEERIANGRLVAEAPKLLEVLKKARVAIYQAYRQPRLLYEIDEVIAKAEGVE